MSNEQIGWHLVGWDGITAQVPADWNIAAITHEPDGGYLRLDDTNQPRVEIKWSVPKGFIDLEETVDKYLKQLQRSRKRDQPAIEVDRDAQVISKRKAQKDALETFAWHAEQDAYGAAWLCKQCGRVVIVQVIGPADEEALAQLAEKVIASITDHPTDGWNTWAAYDFVAQIPEDFELKDQKMMAGLIELSFERNTEKITVARWGMANVALRRHALDEWAQQELGKALAAYKPTSERIKYRGHGALTLTGKRVPLTHAARRLLRHLTGQQCADQLRGFIWHCQPDNKIYVVYGYLDYQNYDLAQQIRDRIVCCQDSQR